MCHHRWRDSEPATGRATALPKTDRGFTIRTAAIVIISATGATATCTAAILVSAALADITLQGCLYRAGIALGKLNDGAVTLVIVLCQGTYQDSAYLYRNTRIPLLRGWRLLFQMGVPHLLHIFVGERWAACQQFIDTDGE